MTDLYMNPFSIYLYFLFTGIPNIIVIFITSRLKLETP